MMAVMTVDSILPDRIDRAFHLHRILSLTGSLFFLLYTDMIFSFFNFILHIYLFFHASY